MTVKTVMDLAYRLTDRMALPRELETLRGRCLLHVSDTPSTFYGDLQRLLLFLCPLALIHTGDVADDVKLELRPREIGLYSRKAADLLGRLGAFPEGLYITGGNHDDAETLRHLAPEATVFDGAAVVTVCGLTLAMAHHFCDLPQPSRPYNLYGHSPSPPAPRREGAVFLNGLDAVNVIAADDGTVHSLPYPAYVNGNRCRKRKIGL